MSSGFLGVKVLHVVFAASGYRVFDEVSVLGFAAIVVPVAAKPF